MFHGFGTQDSPRMILQLHLFVLGTTGRDLKMKEFLLSIFASKHCTMKFLPPIRRAVASWRNFFSE